MANVTPPFRAAYYELPAGKAGQTIALALTTPEIAALLGDALVRIDPWARLGVSAATMTAFLAASNDMRRCFTILDDGRPAGTVAVLHPWLAGPYLNLLAMLPNYQGRGLGSAALDWLEAEATLARARNCFLCVSAFNHRAIAFYQAAGYKLAGHLDSLIVDGEDELLMRKRLDPRPVQ
jgi:ribosomal protein S18 acetylase RimI-like enzyme